MSFYNEVLAIKLKNGKYVNYVLQDFADNIKNLLESKSEKYVQRIIQNHLDISKKLRELIQLDQIKSLSEITFEFLLRKLIKLFVKNDPENFQNKKFNPDIATLEAIWDLNLRLLEHGIFTKKIQHKLVSTNVINEKMNLKSNVFT